ncbi:MerR family transcriptional regulator [Paenibacillus sp. HB172176]|uniref:MerR family transcriptional regulator n=1 Tax=Paenibacillus sp. HB172176 TaxID=2493690 RepID=UPI001438C050|nr:MerR family transcriptional regulator [Paenibacillus sp. HB172176]
MKMKEVCGRTGLTERTVRYYVEEGLIHPEMTVRNGREYREYSESDIEDLHMIASLRKLFFSIDEIKEMQADPDCIASIIGAYKLKLASDATAKSQIVEALEEMEIEAITHVSVLAERLSQLSNKLPLPERDVNPNFGKFEKDSKADRQQQYEQFVKRQAKQFQRGRAIVFLIAALNIAGTIASCFVDFRLFSLLIQIAVSIALFAGVSWVRYLFIAGAIMSVLSGFALLGDENIGHAPGSLLLLFIINVIYSVVAALLLIRSESVREFLYAQKHG